MDEALKSGEEWEDSDESSDISRSSSSNTSLSNEVFQQVDLKMNLISRCSLLTM